LPLMRRHCLVVPKQRAEEIRRSLLERGLLEKHLTVLREGDFILFPVKEQFESEFNFDEREFAEAFKPITHYSEVVDVPEALKSILPTSLDVVGDIALIRLTDELRDHGGAIGEAILRANKSVLCVFADEGVGGEYRIRRLRHLAGENRTKTVHREHGLMYSIDVSKAYFSPRLASERVRVMKQVKPGEVVLDLFTGVGPYAIMIARKSKPSIVYAVDGNPAAFELLEENVRVNRAEKVKAILSDAREALEMTGKVDRLILDLPQSARDYYIGALKSVNVGGMLHYYEIVEFVELEDRKEWLIEFAKRHGIDVELVVTKEVKTYSPAQRHFAFDLRVSRA
jgi:tRNA (guanine37-N1)-methyltransferase